MRKFVKVSENLYEFRDSSGVLATITRDKYGDWTPSDGARRGQTFGTLEEAMFEARKGIR